MNNSQKTSENKSKPNKNQENVKQTIVTDENIETDNDDDSIIDPNGILLHIMVVGFHHKKGCLVEYCYPPLTECDDTKHQISSSKQHCNRNENEIQTESIILPPIWQPLPSLAIPDGAHNYESDTVLFHLPDRNDPNKTVYAVACYRQIQTKMLLVRTSDITRSSVQKSVVALFRIPLYGLIEQKLDIVTRAYFNERDFSKVDVLRESFENLNRQLKANIVNTPEMFTGLSLRALFSKFGPQVMVLFKLLLLERKTIFIMSPIFDLTTTILTLCSLVPGLLQQGLSNCSLPLHLNEESMTESDNTAFKDKARKSSSILSQDYDNKIADKSLKEDCYQISSQSQSAIEPNDAKLNCDIKCKNNPNCYSDDSVTAFTDLKQCPVFVEQTTQIDEVAQEKEFSLDAEQEEQRQNERKRLERIIACPHLYYGFPLRIFDCGSYCLPYFSISYFDLLNSERVRSCMAGSSNQIFKRWENDIDVFVLDSQIEIENVQLKRCLTLTVEDMRFVSYLLDSIESTSTGSQDCEPCLFDEQFSSSQNTNDNVGFYEGSDEWIRCHFKNYLLHMMRCSFLDESSREYRAFNPAFMAAWKECYNYKMWSTGPYTEACFRDIDAQHPFTGNRLNNIRFKLSNFFSVRQEYLNQTLNNASKIVISGALNSARTTMNSWLTNIGISIIQNKSLVSKISGGTQSFLSSYSSQASSCSSSTADTFTTSTTTSSSSSCGVNTRKAAKDHPSITRKPNADQKKCKNKTYSSSSESHDEDNDDDEELEDETSV